MERADYYPCPIPGGIAECPMYKTQAGCREDIHHELQNAPNMTPLMRLFRNMPWNTVIACRRLHVESLDKHPKQYPEPEEMRQAIIDADMAGEICLSATKRRIVYGN